MSNPTPAPVAADALRTRILDLNALLRVNCRDLNAQENVELEVNPTPTKQKVVKKAPPDLENEIFFVVNQRDHPVYEYGDVLRPRTAMTGANVRRENVYFNMFRETPNEVFHVFDTAGNITNKTRFHQGYHCAKPNPRQGEQSQIAALNAQIAALQTEKDNFEAENQRLRDEVDNLRRDQAQVQEQQEQISELERQIAAVRIAIN